MSLEHLDTIIAFVVIITGVSVLVTIMTQSISAVLGLRGTNLRWGLATLLKELDPRLAEHARTISEKVLHHPLLSDSTLSRFDNALVKRWKLASAIRKEELVVILHMLAEQAGTGDARAARPGWVTALAGTLEQLDRVEAEKVLLAAPEIKKAFLSDPAKVDAVLAGMLTSAEHLSGSLLRWFEPMMDRVSQRFVVHVRIWTVLFSILLAFALHLDTLRLLTQLSTDAELRSRLVASSDALVRKADEILVTSPNASSAVYVTAMRQLIAEHKDELPALEEPSGFADLEAGKQWLRDRLTAANVAATDAWLARYEQLVPQATLRKAADDLHEILQDKLKFQLIPDPYPTPFYNYWTPSWMHLWGVIASAALLSLGAPFWFNMLKRLTNLRPTLSNKQDAEKQVA